jgi:hypothetical protein
MAVCINCEKLAFEHFPFCKGHLEGLPKAHPLHIEYIAYMTRLNRPSCVVCGNRISYTRDQDPWCSDECAGKWRRRQPFLFEDLQPKDRDLRKGSGNPKPAFSGENLVAGALQLLHPNSWDDKELAVLRRVSKAIRPLAIEKEVGPAFHKEVTHSQQSRGVTETTPIGPDRMLEIAIMAYNAAILLHRQKKPVILYRIAGKKTLSLQEQMQTLSSSVRAWVDTARGRKEVWPIEKTAAWIQGGMRARVVFVLLNDPRENLVGGVDKQSDAVYVREIFQIISTRYEIGKAPEAVTPEALRKHNILPFVLNPPSVPLGALPTVPRMSKEMAWDHAWDGSKSSLTLGDSDKLIRDHLTELFEEEGKKLGIAPYPVKDWLVN